MPISFNNTSISDEKPVIILTRFAEYGETGVPASFFLLRIPLLNTNIKINNTKLSLANNRSTKAINYIPCDIYHKTGLLSVYYLLHSKTYRFVAKRLPSNG